MSNYIKRLVSIVFILHTMLMISPAQRTLNDTEPLKVFIKAIELYENEKYAAALETFDDFLRISNNDLLTAESFYRIAMSAKNIKLKTTEALFADYLERYPEQNKVNQVYFELGKYTFDNKKYESAVYWLTKIENPKYFEIPKVQDYYFMLGYSAYKTEKYDLAMRAFSQIDSYNNPYFNTANYYKGYIYYKQDKYKEALENFLRVKDIPKLNDLIPVYITHIYLKLGDYKNVIDYGEKALLTPNLSKRADILRYMAQAYFAQKNYAKTVEIFQQMEQKGVNLQNDEIYNYGYALFYSKQYEKSVIYLSQIPLEENEFGQNVAYNLGLAYLKTSDKLKARNVFGFAMKYKYDTEIQETSCLNYAKLSYQLNFQKEAINTLKDFIKNYPQSKYNEDATTLLSEFLLSTSNYKEALEIIEAIPNKNYDIRNTYQQVNYFYGLDLFNNRKYEEATTRFMTSINNEINPRYTSLSYFWLGESYYQLGRTDDAIKHYKNFLFLGESKKTPYFSLGYYNMGYAFYKQEKYQDARNSFKRFTDLEENNRTTERYYDGVIRLGDCNLALKDYDKAIANYSIIIANGYKEVDYAIFQKAIIQGLQKQYESKINTLGIIVEKYPKSTYLDDALFEIANVYFLNEKHATALTKFTSFTQKFPKSPYYTESLLKAGLCHYNLGSDSKALEMFKKVIAEYPYSPEAKEALSALSNIYTENGQGRELIEYLKTIPNLKMTASFQDSALYNAAFSYVKKDNCGEAIKAMDSYLKTYPNGYFAVNAHYYMASCAHNLGYKDVALQHYEAVNEMGYNEFYERSLKNAAALLYFHKKDFANAAKRYKQLEESTGNKDNTLLAVIGLMRSYNKTGNYEQSKAYAEKLLTLSNASVDNKTEAQYHIGIAQYEMKSYDLALATFKLVCEKSKTDMGAEAKYLTANIFYVQEKYNDAMNTIVELKDKYPNSDYWVAKGFILLSDVFVKMGDYFQARHTLESIIANFKGEELLNIAKQKLQLLQQLEQQSKPDSVTTNPNVIEIDQNEIK